MNYRYYVDNIGISTSFYVYAYNSF